MNKLSIIIPVFNEEKTITSVLTTLLSLSLGGIEKEIIVVDDGSSDRTPELIQKFQRKHPQEVRLYLLNVNKGKGEALRHGFKKVTGDYVVIQDADLEYNPSDIRRLIKPIQEERAKVVFGSRLRRLPNFSRDERTVRFFMHYLGNRTLSLITSILYGQYLTDIETGYKVFPAAFLKKTSLTAHGFEIEPEITIQLLRAGYTIHEIAIMTSPRGYKEGKKLRTVPDGMKALLMILRLRL